MSVKGEKISSYVFLALQIWRGMCNSFNIVLILKGKMEVIDIYKY